jgi:hypothetical protein
LGFLSLTILSFGVSGTSGRTINYCRLAGDDYWRFSGHPWKFSRIGGMLNIGKDHNGWLCKKELFR